MSFLKLASVALLSVSILSKAQACDPIHEFEGLIFDAGAFVGENQMETYLDNALLSGVEKAVLFPHPNMTKGNEPASLEQVFPDLVLQGDQPWSNAAAVIWPEPMNAEYLAFFGDELDENRKRNYLLSGITRFDEKTILRLVKNHPNLWVGLNKQDIEAANKQCGAGLLSQLFEVAPGRLVFSSFGEEKVWKYYKWTIKSLRKLASYLPEDQADALMFRNGEELYNVAVNAP
ncbi:exported hypothetical protein [Candidatus Terasakiella magnetica]|uniref:Amidohydrolase-related domain-containing protein n=1 Tax=Candidatus Terasakiella magnetica TaxID=1867952 RepID=A0A1C3RJR4_9PROT|nr:hypothetical protein [Candidatus Terasakiella magnetica]SCA57524.1 exported hypothetical protein [Candidatus Terasakiella magnetica]